MRSCKNIAIHIDALCKKKYFHDVKTVEIQFVELRTVFFSA